MKIILFTGSFNPVHKGHVALAKYVVDHTSVDAVWMMVSPQNPLKSSQDLWPEALRYELLQLATSHVSGVEASDFELSLPKPTYTYKTLEAIKKAYPQHDFLLLIGEDNAKIFDQWKNYDQIIDHFPVWVFPRHTLASDHSMASEPSSLPQKDYSAVQEELQKRMVFLQTPFYDYSSTEVRRALAAGQSIAGLVDVKVEERLLAYKSTKSPQKPSFKEKNVR